MIAAGLAAIVLLTTLVLMIVLAVNVTTMTQVGNMDDPQQADEDKSNAAEKNVAGISPILSLLGGYSLGSGLFYVLGGYFNYNSLSFVLPTLTLIFGIGLAINDRKGQETEKKAGSGGTQHASSSSAYAPPPPPKSFQNRDPYSQDYPHSSYDDDRQTRYDNDRRSSYGGNQKTNYNDPYKSY